MSSGGRRLISSLSSETLLLYGTSFLPAGASEVLREGILRRSDVSVRRTRATESGQLQLPKVRTELARRSFFYRAISAWNNAIVNAEASIV